MLKLRAIIPSYVAVVLVACGGSAPTAKMEGMGPSPAEISAPIAATQEEAPEPAVATGVPLSIASDAKAEYWVLSVERGQKGLLFIQTKRSGSSGVSFSERQVNCVTKTFAYTREGDTLEGLLATPRKPDPMGPRLEGSISDVVSQYACDHPPAD